jgi:hypothetical protein
MYLISQEILIVGYFAANFWSSYILMKMINFNLVNLRVKKLMNTGKKLKTY